MRRRQPNPPADDIPAWFTTYSDVITLLMTFFILLLTFATDEPEKFQRMKVAAFGGGGELGLVGPEQSGLQKDSMVLRERPPSSRLSVRGSEMPPIYSDPAHQSLAVGLAGLEHPERKYLLETHVIRIPLVLLVTRSGELTELARLQLRMLARQLTRFPFEVSLLVSGEQDLPATVRMAHYLVQQSAIAPGRVGVGLLDATGLSQASANEGTARMPVSTGARFLQINLVRRRQG